MTTPHTHIKQIAADGVSVFYREAGSANAPVVLLLHGFPSSSFQYRNLIPILATKYRVIAPDLPGFGFTNVPDERKYTYSFDGIKKTIEAFVDALKLKKFSIYIFDYGAPTGLRLALDRPESVTAIISQNGNAYIEGLGEFWAPIKKYWNDPSTENREAIRSFTDFETTKFQYVHGAPDPSALAPEAWTLDATLLQRPGNADIQLDLFLDYQHNVELYPDFQAYFRKYQPPTLAIWGKNDPIFIPPGAEGFKKDNPKTVVKLIDAGHFALESHLAEIAADIIEFLEERGI